MEQATGQGCSARGIPWALFTQERIHWHSHGLNVFRGVYVRRESIHSKMPWDPKYPVEYPVCAYIP